MTLAALLLLLTGPALLVLTLVGLQRWTPYLFKAPNRHRRVPDYARIRALKAWHAQWEQDEARRAEQDCPCLIQRDATGRIVFAELCPRHSGVLDDSPDPEEW